MDRQEWEVVFAVLYIPCVFLDDDYEYAGGPDEMYRLHASTEI